MSSHCQPMQDNAGNAGVRRRKSVVLVLYMTTVIV